MFRNYIKSLMIIMETSLSMKRIKVQHRAQRKSKTKRKKAKDLRTLTQIKNHMEITVE